MRRPPSLPPVAIAAAAGCAGAASVRPPPPPAQSSLGVTLSGWGEGDRALAVRAVEGLRLPGLRLRTVRSGGAVVLSLDASAVECRPADDPRVPPGGTLFAECDQRARRVRVFAACVAGQSEALRTRVIRHEVLHALGAGPCGDDCRAARAQHVCSKPDETVDCGPTRRPQGTDALLAPFVPPGDSPLTEPTAADLREFRRVWPVAR